MGRKGKGRGRGIPSQNDGTGEPQRPGVQQTVVSTQVESSSTSKNGSETAKGRGRGKQLKTTEGSSQSKAGITNPPKQVDDHSQPSTSTGITESACSEEMSNSVPTNEFFLNPFITNVDASKMAVRPGYGTEGRRINLVSNYYSMQPTKTVIFHYDVEINSRDRKKPSNTNTHAEAKRKGISLVEHQLSRNVGKIKCKEVMEHLVQLKAFQKYNPIYDGGKNIYTSSPLPIKKKESFNVALTVSGKTKDYEVVIQPVEKDDGSNMISLKPIKTMKAGKVDNIPQEILTALNTIMNHRDSHSNQVQVGRAFFYLNQKQTIPLGEGIEIWFGYNQSVHFTEKGPALVLNISAKAVHKAGAVIDYANDVLRCDITRASSLNAFQISKLASALKGLKVQVTHLSHPRRYTVQNVSKLSARDLRLDIDGSQVSVADYFKNKYKALRFPHLPCLHMRSNNNQTFVPIESCNISEGQPKLGKLGPLATRKMIKETAIPAEERFRSIAHYADTVRKESGEQMTNFSLFMGLAPIKVEGRVIEPPLLAYYDEVKNVIRPDFKGTWRMDGKRFFRTTPSSSWILLSFVDPRNCSREYLEKFANILMISGRKAGLEVGKLLEIKMFGHNVKMWDALVYAKNSGASFAVAVLTKMEDYHSYEELKFIGDYHLGLVTQCMDVDVIARFTDKIASNVCLKINTKLGGVNHILSKRPAILLKPVIIFGADAVHSTRGSGCPSIAAVVGSLDSFLSKYKLTCRVQDNPDGNKISQEQILELQQMVETILRAFSDNTKGKFPEKIIFYRDGVSEGQFPSILEKEVTHIQKACKAVIGKTIPITFIIVQKRHQTRFRPEFTKDGVGRMGNIPPGTTIDRDVVHPRFFDFFLCSHEGIQGTSKIAKYTVLHDDNNFSVDEIEKLSYYLCHMYARCNRSVSIPAPVMYADLAAYRAKKYADWHIQKAPDTSSNSSDHYCRLPDHVRDAINKMEKFSTNMFFV